MSERTRREAAYRETSQAVLAYIEGEDADLFNMLDEAAKVDALATAYRLTYLAARAVEDLARIQNATPSEILDRLVRAKNA